MISDLERALSSLGAVAHVTSALARSVAGSAIDAHGDPLPLIRWMNDLEATHRSVLYVCDPTLTPWTHRCLRQADRVLLIDSTRDDPQPGEVEQEIDVVRGKGAMSVRIDLALVHPAGTRRPVGTERWLARRRVDSHHHIRERCFDARSSSYPPGWKVLAHGLNPSGKRVSVPTLVHILFRTEGLSSHAATERARAECALYLKPSTGGYNFLDFSPVKEIAEEGYQSTKLRIAEWKSSRAARSP